MSLQKTPILIFDVNPTSFSTNLEFLYHPVSKVKLFANIQTDPFAEKSENNETNYSIEYLGDCSTTTFTLYNPKLESGRATLAYLKSFAGKFAAGGEILRVWNNQQTYTSCAIAMRYTTYRTLCKIR